MQSAAPHNAVSDSLFLTSSHIQHIGDPTGLTEVEETRRLSALARTGLVGMRLANVTRA
jgi:hypothetical protein